MNIKINKEYSKSMWWTKFWEKYPTIFL